MDAGEIAGLGSSLMDFLVEFDDCFGRCEPREHLRTYVATLGTPEGAVALR